MQQKLYTTLVPPWAVVVAQLAERLRPMSEAPFQLSLFT